MTEWRAAQNLKTPNRAEQRENKRENGEATWTNRRILQEEGRVEEASDAQQSAPPRHPWPRHRPRRLWHLSGRRAGLQQDICSFLLSSSPTTIFFSLPLRSGLPFFPFLSILLFPSLFHYTLGLRSGLLTRFDSDALRFHNRICYPYLGFYPLGERSMFL